MQKRTKKNKSTSQQQCQPQRQRQQREKEQANQNGKKIAKTHPSEDNELPAMNRKEMT